MQLFDRLDGPAQVSPAPGPGPGPLVSAERSGQLASLLDMVSAADLSLADVLRHLAEELAAGLPAETGVVVAVRRADGRRELASTSDPARAADELQRGLREGPVLDCLATGQAVTSTDLRQDARWPRLAGSAALVAGGARSAVCLPVPLDGLASGTLSAYSPDRGAFDDQQTRAPLVRLAAAVAPAVADALVLDEARRLTLPLHLQASDRRAVEEAVGVLMDEHGTGHEEALTVLQTLGRTEHGDLAAAARAVAASRTADRRQPV